MKEQPISEQDQRRKRALIIFQVLIYGYLFGMFLLQLHLYHVRDW